ncbi:phenylalanine ammonia-lyase [Saccharata proteae CBS 121410]|uniref:Phenylalanine ammonia-lyase n=1 Tax=Saccharata proteae CBS 121410 TaxID=1314787 RepID=A0A9P4LYP5_9PEZI|nr:phenylalanine ammonia-lyase [Saccharata proteae CBS 121410]
MDEPRIDSTAVSKTPKIHARSIYQTYKRLQDVNCGQDVMLDGDSLTIADLVAVAKYGAKPKLDKSEDVVSRIESSVEMLKKHLDRGDHVYGVNTGYGGSADTRTKNLPSLQRALLQHQQSGILTSLDMGKPTLEDSENSLNAHRDDLASTAMPSSWVKGTMLSRINSIIRGHSAVSLPVIEQILAFLHHDITPVIPLRGSISASGDLSPLSYIAGALEGSSGVYVRMGGSHGIKTAKEALEIIGLRPVILAAKEGLGLLNGTAASASAASLALYETHHLAALSQVLTSMAVEALCGTAESFHPFIANIRPHKGQLEASANILGFLQGSALASGLKGEKDKQISGLYQDRYPLRTSSQWIGPQLEDLMLANEQVAVELNSTTDNPLIDVDGDVIHHGGNFQAASLSSAMEKTRTAIQMIGKLLFAQGTELINSSLNNGLPPNLAADDPSLSFTCKGIDINLAAYMSELGFLANPVSSHVQSAELHNQAVNSLALISARYTLQSVEVLSSMSAAFLFALCQALDLRVLQAQFLGRLNEEIKVFTKDTFGTTRSDMAEQLFEKIWPAVKTTWNTSTTQDLSDRSEKCAQTAAHIALWQNPSAFPAVTTFKDELVSLISCTYDSARQEMFANHIDTTPKYLGQAAAKMYLYVRKDLGIPFHRGLVEHPTQPLEVGGQQPSGPAEQRRTIGSQVSVIYEALRSGGLHGPVMAALRENGV